MADALKINKTLKKLTVDCASEVPSRFPHPLGINYWPGFERDGRNEERWRRRFCIHILCWRFGSCKEEPSSQSLNVLRFQGAVSKIIGWWFLFSFQWFGQVKFVFRQRYYIIQGAVLSLVKTRTLLWNLRRERHLECRSIWTAAGGAPPFAHERRFAQWERWSGASVIAVRSDHAIATVLRWWLYTFDVSSVLRPQRSRLTAFAGKSRRLGGQWQVGLRPQGFYLYWLPWGNLSLNVVGEDGLRCIGQHTTTTRRWRGCSLLLKRRWMRQTSTMARTLRAKKMFLVELFRFGVEGLFSAQRCNLARSPHIGGQSKSYKQKIAKICKSEDSKNFCMQAQGFRCTINITAAWVPWACDRTIYSEKSFIQRL